MVVLLNGAFGVGKSAVAARVARRAPHIRLFDPERIGYVLGRIPARLPGSTRSLADYQDSSLWRRLTVRSAARLAKRHRLVLMPMCFVRADYLDEIRRGVEERGLHWAQLCLTASAETVRGRLRDRGLDPDSEEGQWVYPRARSASEAHGAGGYGVTIATDGIDADDVSARVLARIESFAEKVNES